VRATVVLALAALLAVAGSGCARKPSASETKQWTDTIARLEAEQDSLRTVAAAMIARDPRLSGLPQGDVVVSVPTSFVRNVLLRVFDEVADHVTLRLGGIKARVEKSVKKIVKIGDFTVDIRIDEVVGELRPQEPAVRFDGGRIGLRLPVEVHKGTGKATIHFVWDGKNVAGVACGDMDVTRTLTANVVPARYVVSGALDLAMKDNRIVGTPRLPVTRLNLKVSPTKASWDQVHALLDEKKGACGYVLDKVDVPNILRKLVQEKGFNVTLPFHKLRPFTVPGGVSDSVSVQGRVLAVEATSNMLRIDPDAILYGVNVSLR
jgi:hypothetical protein